MVHKHSVYTGYVFTSLQASNGLLSVMFGRQEHLCACFSTVGFSVFISVSAEEKAKHNQKDNRGCLSADI